MRAWVLLGLLACGGSEPIAPAVQPAPAPVVIAKRCGPGVPVAACIAPDVRICGTHDADRIGEWRYAVIASAFEPVEDVSVDELVAAWRSGKLAATAETRAALEPSLGSGASEMTEHPRLDAEHWAIVPAHELSPSWKVIAIAGHHPLVAASPLVVALCGKTKVSNIDRERITTLVMSGTTALTRRIAERIDTSGVRDTVRHVRPWFEAADLVHISNETAFVRDCDPKQGARLLSFCSRERYIELLETVNTKIVELTGSHLLDYGSPWLRRTIDMYAKRGWVWFGGGRTQIEATAPRIVEHHGNRLAFLGCNAIATWLHWVTTDAGVAACDWARMTWQVQDLRRRGYLPIVSIQHMEVNTHEPPADLVRDLRRMAEAGAVFVMGSQAHSAHPWEVHHSAYVHYGPGNIFFAQGLEPLREAAIDKLYFHAGKLLTVEHLYTRLEHGQPRLLTARERVRFLGQMARVAGKLPPAEPWIVPKLPDETRSHPDSVVVHGKPQSLVVQVPEHVDEHAHYPLVVDLAGTSRPVANAFVVTLAGKPRATAREVVEFMRAKYPVDPARTSIVKSASGN